MTPHRATFWRRRAVRTFLRHNLARVLAGFLPACLGVSAAFAGVLLVARANGGGGPKLWLGYGLALLAGLVFALWRARKEFLGLHNRLSAAAAGVGAFPAVQAAPDGCTFRSRKIMAPLAGAAAMVCTAAWVPITNHAAPALPPVPPVAWTQMAGWIDALKKTDVLQPPALEDLRERLEQLRKQPAADWYRQNSLEAGDSLREQTVQSVAALQRDLRATLGDLAAAQRYTDGTSSLEMKATREHFENALKGLELGSGRRNASFEDVQAVATPVWQHRIVLDYHARIDGLTLAEVVRALLDEVPAQAQPVPATLMSAKR